MNLELFQRIIEIDRRSRELDHLAGCHWDDLRLYIIEHGAPRDENRGQRRRRRYPNHMEER